MPAGMVVADNAAPQFSKDGARLALATAPPPPPPPDPDAKTPAPIQVDLWSWNDAIIQPMQKVRAEQERTRNYRAVVSLADRKFMQLATPDLPTVNVTDDSAHALGLSDLPYRKEISWDQTYNDVYLVDLKSGKPQKMLEHWGSNTTSLSPGGKYILYFDENTGQWFTYRVADGVRTNITQKLPTKFQQENNTPDLPGPYGTGGWTANDQSLLLYDEFDVWDVKPDGSGARMITAGEGRKQHVAFRYRSLDPEQTTVPTNVPLLLSATNDDTRATGFYRASFTGTAAPEKVVMLDKAFGPVTKAEKADTVVFTLSRFEEFPNLWVSDTSFKNMQKVSDANPQQSELVWGTSELIDYINADGKTLRAILTKPDNFDPKKKYPLMVYIYEELTQGLHSYAAPNVGTSINIPRYVSNGYVVLRPDIVYTTGYPGEAAEKCVIPAVNTVVSMGFIDPKRIGIQGHSWGGYQITHLITRTNMFAAVEAGASVSNMISAYGGIRWGTGMVREFQYREDPEPHRRPTLGRAAPVHRELTDLLGQENPDAVSHDPQRRGRRGPLVPGHRVQHRHAPAREGGLHVLLQRRAARPAQPRQHEALDRPHGRVLRPLPARQAASGVDGQGRLLPGQGQARRLAHVQEKSCAHHHCGSVKHCRLQVADCRFDTD